MLKGAEIIIFGGGYALLVMTMLPGAALHGGLISLWPVFFVALVMAGLIWAFALWEPNALVKRRWTVPSIGEFISKGIMLLCFTGWLMLLPAWGNVLLDPNDTYEVEVDVTSVGTQHLRRSPYDVAQVKGWPSNDGAIDIRVQSGPENALAVGDRVRLEVGDGLLGLKYVVGYTRVD